MLFTLTEQSIAITKILTESQYHLQKLIHTLFGIQELKKTEFDKDLCSCISQESVNIQSRRLIFSLSVLYINDKRHITFEFDITSFIYT